MSVLGPIPDFEAEDSFLHAFLGLVAASRESAAVLGAAAQVHDAAAHDDDARPTAEPEDDLVLDALLGIVRLSGLVSSVAEGWATADAGPPSTRRAPSERVEGILR